MRSSRTVDYLQRSWSRRWSTTAGGRPHHLPAVGRPRAAPQQEDVLGSAELCRPTMEEFSWSDRRHQRAVLAGNFMAMRRAAFVGGDGGPRPSWAGCWRSSRRPGRTGARWSSSPTSGMCWRWSSPPRTGRRRCSWRHRPPSGSSWWTPSPPGTARRPGQPDPGRWGGAQHAGRVGGDPVRAAGQTTMETGDRPCPPDGAVRRSGAPAAGRGQRRPADAGDLDTKSVLFDEYARRRPAEHSPGPWTSAAELARQVVPERETG